MPVAGQDKYLGRGFPLLASQSTRKAFEAASCTGSGQYVHWQFYKKGRAAYDNLSALHGLTFQLPNNDGLARL